ncbi:hypothetical protein EON67_11945, partial [archaeon]
MVLQVGPSCTPAELVDLVRVLWPNPAAAPGKITIITRLGANGVRDKLPALVHAIHVRRASSGCVRDACAVAVACCSRAHTLPPVDRACRPPTSARQWCGRATPCTAIR